MWKEWNSNPYVHIELSTRRSFLLRDPPLPLGKRVQRHRYHAVVEWSTLYEKQLVWDHQPPGSGADRKEVKQGEHSGYVCAIEHSQALKPKSYFASSLLWCIAHSDMIKMDLQTVYCWSRSQNRRKWASKTNSAPTGWDRESELSLLLLRIPHPLCIRNSWPSPSRRRILSKLG